VSKATAHCRRACAALVVVFGVLLLHSLPMTHPPGGHGSGAQLHAPASVGETPGTPATTGTHHGPAAPVPDAAVTATMSSAIDGTPHLAMAMCIAMVTIVAALLINLYLAPHSDQKSGGRSRAASSGRHLSRAPPWAGPTLEKLSILRI
jgi:Family of unknown function (DUF6153)